MDGLECSEINLEFVKNHYFRFDAEYYSKEHLKLEQFIDEIGHKTIKDYGVSLDCSAFYPSIKGFYSRNKNHIPFLRVNEISDGFVSITDNTVFLPRFVITANIGTIAIAKPGDILIAKGGNSLAKVGIVTQEFQEYAVCRDVIILRTDALNETDRYYLWAFLHSHYGQSILWRSASQTGQPHLTMPSIINMKVPELNLKIKEIISSLYVESVEMKSLSKETYNAASDLLLDNLGFSSVTLSKEGVATKSLSESFGASGRLDAEYYQPKYAEIEKALKTSDTVGTLCKLYDANYIPNAKQSYRYIELANVGLTGEIQGVEKLIGSNLPSRARRIVKTGQVIISSIEGSLQSCAFITDDYNNALCSTGFYVMDSAVMNAETLLVLFKSEPIQALMKQRCSGTILTAISKENLLSMPLPFIDNFIQEQISQKVQESFALRKQAQNMIDIAVQAVEIAIEDGEDKALKWLEDQGVLNNAN